MRVQHGLISVVAILLAMIMISGTFLSEQFPQGVHAQAVGFDALAHSLFGGAPAAGRHS